MVHVALETWAAVVFVARRFYEEMKVEWTHYAAVAAYSSASDEN